MSLFPRPDFQTCSDCGKPGTCRELHFCCKPKDDMRSKNKPAPTAAEKAHIERVAALPCVICDAEGVEVHEPEQGLWWVSIPLCPACHRGPEGWHGTRLRWKLRKVGELDAINETLRRLA